MDRVIGAPTKAMEFLDDDAVCAIRYASDKYGLSAKVILKLSSVLLEVVARDCMAHRQQALDLAEASHTELEANSGTFLLHGAGMFPRDRFDQASDAEAASIAANDVLGARIAHASSDFRRSATGPEDDSFARLNPLACYLAARCKGFVSDLLVTADDASFKPVARQEAAGPCQQSGGTRS